MEIHPINIQSRYWLNCHQSHIFSSNFPCASSSEHMAERKVDLLIHLENRSNHQRKMSEFACPPLEHFCHSSGIDGPEQSHCRVALWRFSRWTNLSTSPFSSVSQLLSSDRSDLHLILDPTPHSSMRQLMLSANLYWLHRDQTLLPSEEMRSREPLVSND